MQINEYRLAPGDRIFIFVESHANLSREFLVRPDGRITTPLVEDLQVAGKTASEVAAALETRLEAQIVEPIVTVKVIEVVGLSSQSIRVIGAAADPRIDVEGPRAVQRPLPTKPAAVPYKENMSLMDVILQVGGLSQFANGNRAYVLRRQGGELMEIPVRLDDLLDDRDMSANIAMAPGDILVIPEGSLSGDWVVQSRIGAFATGTDNVGLAPDGEKNPALIFSLTPGFSVRGTTPRFSGAADADLLMNYQEVYGNRRETTPQGFDPYLSFLGTSTTELVRDDFFVDAGASIGQQSSGLGDATSVSEFVQTGRQTTAVINVSPYVPMRLSNLANAQLRYNFGAFLEGEEDVNFVDSFSNLQQSDIIHQLGLTVGSTPKTSALGIWEFLMSGSLEDRNNEDDDAETSQIKTALIKLDWAYPLTAQFSALFTGGWDYRDEENDENDINAPRGGIGAQWRPSPAFDASATFGYADARSNVSANLRYTPSPLTNVFLTYREGVDTAARVLVDSLALIEIDRQSGDLINSETGILFDPFFRGTGRRSTTTQFIRRARAGAQTEQGNNIFNIGGEYYSEEPTNDEEGGEEEEEEDGYRFAAGWQRAFSTQTRGNITVAYERTELEDRNDNVWILKTGIIHQISDTVEARLTYGFQNRESTTGSFDFTENVVTIGAIARF